MTREDFFVIAWNVVKNVMLVAAFVWIFYKYMISTSVKKTAKSAVSTSSTNLQIGSIFL